MFCEIMRNQTLPTHTMARTLYSPRLSDDVIRALYREGQRQRMPMTKLADRLLRQSLGSLTTEAKALNLVREDPPEPQTTRAGAA